MIAEEFKAGLSRILANFKQSRDGATPGIFGGGRSFMDFYDEIAIISQSNEEEVDRLLGDTIAATKKYFRASSDTRFLSFEKFVNFYLIDILITFSKHLKPGLSIEADAVKLKDMYVEKADDLAEEKRQSDEMLKKANEATHKMEVDKERIIGEKRKFEEALKVEKRDRERFEQDATKYREKKRARKDELNKTIRIYEEQKRRLDETMAVLNQTRMELDQSKAVNGVSLDEGFLAADLNRSVVRPFSSNPNTMTYNTRGRRGKRRYILDDLKFCWSQARIDMLKILNKWYSDNSDEIALFEMMRQLYKEEATPQQIMEILNTQHSIQSHEVLTGVLASCSKIKALDAQDSLLWVKNEKGEVVEDSLNCNRSKQYQNKAAILHNLIRQGVVPEIDDFDQKYFLDLHNKFSVRSNDKHMRLEVK